METKIFREDLTEAARIISDGGLVAVPTETVYGLAADGLNAQAVEKIYEVKGRPSIKPLSLMVPGEEAMDKYCVAVPQTARALAGKFWPGPLTIILKAKDFIPSIVLAGGNTVGLRCPQHPVTLSLLRTLSVPLAAPSANPSGQKSPQTAAQVQAYFEGKIDGIIDGGVCDLGLESTIVDMSSKPYKILRQGALSAEKIQKTLADNLNVIGITGGTGSGKTTALNLLKAKGALVLDCDEVYHDLLFNNEEMLSEIEKEFQGVINNGALDRKALGAIVFNDDQKLSILNSITHKYVDMEVQHRLEEFAMSGGTLAAIDAIELFAGNQAKRCKKTLGILAKPDIRAQRIMARDGISLEYAMLRIQAQRPDSYFENLCDYILRNDGTSEEFEEKCSKLFEEIL